MRQLSFFAALLLISSAVMAQTRQLTGSVKDSRSGTAIPAVTVKVKGKNIQTITSTDGSFSLTVPAGNISLEITSVGYSPKTIAADAGSATIDVTLEATSADLGEVVVTALGISKEAKKVGYAVTTVSGDQMTKARENNVALSLEGQVAGLNVHGTNGGPGGSARILLRGVSSLTGGGSPLFVVNGVPIDNSNRGSAGEWGGADAGDGIGNINPDDIESMTVLKGLAASALYGSRASNGVILITTKKGKKGTANIEYNGNLVVEKAINSTDYQYEYGQGTGGAKPATTSAAQATARFAWGARMDGSTFTGADGKTYNYSPYKNNIADFYRYGPSFTNTVSVNGGGENGTYRLSLSNLSNNAIVRNSGLDRKTINFNIDQKITDKLSITLLANYIDQKAKNPPQLSDGPGNPNNGLFLAPNIKETTLSPGYDANGREIVFSDDNYVTNPYFAVNKWVNDVSRKRLISAVSAKYNFTNWLYLQGRLGYDKENDRSFGVTPTGTDYSYNSLGQSGGIGITTQETSELNLDALLGASHKLLQDLNVDVTVGANSRRNKSEYLNISGGPFVIPNLYAPGNVVSFGRGYGFSERAVHSGFYSVDFTYNNFLTLGTTGRYDAFSTLYNSGIPKGERNIFSPSVSASFLFSQLADIPAISYGKLRASYAQTSGEPANPYQTAVYYSVGNAINGVSTGSFSGTLPNLFLKPYKLNELEVGTELKFLNNRLGVDVAYFTRKSSNEIMNANISWSTGYSSSVISNGSIQNKGVEVMVTGNPFKSKNFNWNVSLNLTSVKNEVLKTDAAGNNLGQGTYRPLNANTAYIVGLPGPQVLAHDYTYDAKGQIVVDASGLPVQGGLIPMGSVLPNLYGGLKNDFSYKNIDLSFLIDYNYGNKVLSATKYYALYRGLDKETLAGRESGIKVNGVLANGTPNTVTATAESYYQRLASISRVNVLDGDYIKLRQITLGYTISEKALSNIPVFSSIQISLVARNLFTLMKHTDNIDPEAGFSSTIRYAGIEGTSLPSTRSFGINANFKFKNNNMKKFLIYATFIMALFLTGCTKNFDELNTDPTQASAANFDPNLLLPSGELGYTSAISGYSGPILFQSMWTQIFSSAIYPGYYTGGDKYVQGGSFLSYQASTWNNAYQAAGYLREIQNLTSGNAGLSNLSGISSIVEMLNIEAVTDVYGDAPYSQGLQAKSGISQPVYDKQQDIYNSMLARLDSVIPTLDASKTKPTNDVFPYKGDIAKWKKFGYSLMLRMAMRLTKADAPTAQKYAEKAFAGGLFTSNDDNAYIVFDNAHGFNNANSSALAVAEDYSEVKWGKMLIDYLKSTSDPRLGVIAEVPKPGKANAANESLAGDPTPANQQGMPNGYDQNGGATDISHAPGFPGGTGTGADINVTGGYSRPTSAVYLALNTPTFILTYAEIEYLLAEAAVRGWAVGASASVHYANGLAAALQTYSTLNAAGTISAAVATGYAAANPLDVSSTENSLKQINTQFWVYTGTIFNFDEAWSNWRRSGYPVLTPVNYSGNFTGGTIPRRQAYPTSEASNDPSGYNTAIGNIQGGDTYTGRVWWDK